MVTGHQFVAARGVPWRWSLTVKACRVLIAGVASVSAFAVMAAAPAQADAATYLQRLQTNYIYLNPQQWLAEGYRVCQAERSGLNSWDAVSMVYNDLAVSMTVADDIVTDAVDGARLLTGAPPTFTVQLADGQVAQVTADEVTTRQDGSLWLLKAVAPKPAAPARRRAREACGRVASRRTHRSSGRESRRRRGSQGSGVHRRFWGQIR